MQRYFAINIDNNQLELLNDDYYHIKTVMRMKQGDSIEVVYDKILYHAILNDNLIPVINNQLESNTTPLNVTLAPAIIKETNWNYLLQKATELNAQSIIPINTKRSIINITNDKKDKKQSRWQKIVKEASEQSKRLDIPVIFDIIDMEYINTSDYDLCIYGNPTSKENIKNIIKKIDSNTKILFLSGPEGGLTDQEMDYLDNKGFIGISLGTTVYRAETVPLVVLSMINYKLME